MPEQKPPCIFAQSAGKTKLNMNKIKYFSLLLLATLFMAGCSDDDADGASGSYIVIDEQYLSFDLDADKTSIDIEFEARSSWTATLSDGASGWVTLFTTSGIGGSHSFTFAVGANSSESSRTATITLTCHGEKKVITIQQAGSTLQIMDESEVKDLDRFYKPAEFSGINMFRSDAKWSWYRSAQSEHFFVFWEAGFGDDPNDDSVDSALRVDIDDLLEKAEQFYTTNIEKLGFADVGQGKSYLDQYKMEIYLLYQTEWLATGSGYDNVIGALWVNPSTCQPVGSTIAHEIGHSFQYQVYCDKLYQGEADDYLTGFRYGYVGSNGGNGFWEQCAQWQSYQDYPEEMFTTYNFDVWLANNHRHFEHEWMRYASYWLQTYWTAKHGDTTVASVWKESAYPEDAISTYMRLYCGNDWTTMSEELYDYAARMASFDIDGMREYSNGYIGGYGTSFCSAGDYYQVAYANCPGTTGFNVIPLNIPDGGGTVTAELVGLAPGSALAADDPGEYMVSEAVAGTRSTYNGGETARSGWKYSFVAMSSSGTRTYGDVIDGQLGAATTATFNVPANTEYLWLVVMGCPTSYAVSPWDEDETTDEQWPYKVKFTGTDLKGNVVIDTDADPESISLSHTITCDASTAGYELGTIDLSATGDLEKIAQAFVMQSSTLSSSTLTISNGTTVEPTEGKVVFVLTQSDGSYGCTYTSNVGFYVTAEGDVGSWSDGDPLWVEYDKDNFIITYGHYPGKTTEGTTYVVKPTLLYVKDGVQYAVTITLNLQF